MTPDQAHPINPNATDPVLVTLDEDTLNALATRVADLITERTTTTTNPGEGQLLSAAQVAARWNVATQWVYQHPAELQAIRLGTGSRPRLRFDPDLVSAYLTAAAAPRAAPVGRRRPAREVHRSSSHNIPKNPRGLLPIVGDSELTSTTPRHGRQTSPPTMTTGPRCPQ